MKNYQIQITTETLLFFHTVKHQCVIYANVLLTLFLI